MGYRQRALEIRACNLLLQSVQQGAVQRGVGQGETAHVQQQEDKIVKCLERNRNGRREDQQVRVGFAVTGVNERVQMSRPGACLFFPV